MCAKIDKVVSLTRYKLQFQKESKKELAESRERAHNPIEVSFQLPSFPLAYLWEVFSDTPTPQDGVGSHYEDRICILSLAMQRVDDLSAPSEMFFDQSVHDFPQRPEWKEVWVGVFIVMDI